MTLGKRIKIAREACGKTQRDLAERFSVSTQAVSQWEKDETLPTMERLLELPLFLDVSADWLLYARGNPRTGDDLARFIGTLRGKARARALKMLQAAFSEDEDVNAA